MRTTITERIASDATLAQPALTIRFDAPASRLRGWYRLKLRLDRGLLRRVALSATDATGHVTAFEHVCGQNQFRCYIYVSGHVADIAIVAEAAEPGGALVALRPLSLAELLLKSMSSGFSDAPLRFLRYFRDPLDDFIVSFAYPAPRTQADLYRRWIATRETVAREAERARIGVTTRERPEIGILLTVCDPQPRYLKKALESVLRQTSPHWKLHIADDASRNPEIRALLSSFARGDARITRSFREQRGGISAATNEAFSSATSPFVACLDHDDLLAPEAVEFVANHLAENPDCALLFSDEDKIDERDQRFAPYFKPPQFSPELFYSYNYINHWTVHRAATVRDVGGWRSDFDGAQDYDLTLRTLKKTGADRFAHLAHVLYHWRAIAGSAAADVNYKPYAIEKGRQALLRHFEDRPGVGVEVVSETMYRIVRPVDAAQAGVAVLVPFRDRPDLLATCVDSVLNKTSYSNLELVLIDNGSVEPQTLALLRALRLDPRVRIVTHDKPFNYSRLNNLGVLATDKEYICLLNNDVEAIDPGWLTDMMSYATSPGVGCVGAKLLYPSGTVQHAGVILGLGGVAGHAFLNAKSDAPGYFGRLRIASNYAAVTGACLLVKRETFLKAGGLDEDRLGIAFNDIDLCLKVQALGYRNVVTPFAQLIHHESASRGAENTPEKVARFQRECGVMLDRHASILMHDPCYSAHLSLSADFEIDLGDAAR